MRSAGYHPQTNRDGETSYVKSIRGAGFPRFHVYANEMPSGWEITLHLDQKKPTYEGFSAHSGDYDGAAVEKELERIKSFF